MGRVAQGLYAFRDPAFRQIWGDDQTLHAAPLQGFSYGPGKLVVAHAVDRCFVLRRTLGEARDDLLARGVVFLAVPALDRLIFGAFGLGHVAGGVPYAPQ